MNRHFTNRFNRALTERRKQLHEAEENLSNFWESDQDGWDGWPVGPLDQQRLEALISRREILKAQVSELVGVLGMMNNRAAA